MADVTFLVDQTAPASNGAVTTPAGGSWTGATYSFLVCARYADDTTDVDNYGADRTTPAAWETIVVSTNDSVVIPVSIDTDRQFTFEVLRQTASSFTPGSAAALIDQAEITVTQTAHGEYTLTIDSEASSANLTIGAAATTKSFSPPATPEAVYREKNGRSYRGKLTQRSFIDSRTIEQIIITANFYTAIPSATIAVLQKWMDNSVYLKLTMPSGAVSRWASVHGVIQNLSFFDSRHVQENAIITFDVDAESTS